MTDPTDGPDLLSRERIAIFSLAALLLLSIVSISFFNLDRHPAFPPPDDDIQAVIDETPTPSILATDPIAYATLESYRGPDTPDITPLTHWPPQGVLFAFGQTTALDDDLEFLERQSVWSVWAPHDLDGWPHFEHALIDLLDAHGHRATCSVRDDGSHHCLLDETSSRVKPQQVTVAGAPAQCINAPPIPGLRLLIRYPYILPVTDDGERLYLLTAHDDDAVDSSADVHIGVVAGDERFDHHHRARRGWQRRSLPPKTYPVELQLEISAADEAPQFCFRFERQ